MIRKVIPFRHWHYEWINESGEPNPLRPALSALVQLERENSWTGVVDGEVIACAGTIMQWPGRHVAWALLAKNGAQHMVWITRQVRANIAHVAGRIELTVRADFPQGQKWARLLGFSIETPVLKQFGPEGEDHIGYVRIN